MASQVPPPIDGAPTQAEGSSRPKAPMSDYNVKALTALRADLKTNILMDTYLNDHLENEAEGFMTRPEAQSVRSDRKSQMGQLIDILLGKGDEEFRIFCEMLRKSNYLAWAEELEQKAESFKSKGLKEVLLRKQSRSCASSGETPSSSAEKRTQDEYKKMEQDLEKQDFRSMRERCCPDRAIRLLYANAHKRLVQLLKPHLDAVKDAADTYIQLGLHEAEGEKPCDIQSVQRMNELINQMSTRSAWDSTCFLQQAVDAIPAMAIEREVAEAILAHYNCHLDIYNRAKLLKDHLTTKRSESDKEGKEIEFEKLVPVKITSSKPYDEFTCEDCYLLQARILSQAFSIPKEQIICYDALPCQSTTVIFFVPNGFIYVIMQHTTRLETVWTLLELDVIEVAISGFTFKPTVGCFLALLRGSKPFTADLLGVTEILPFQMHCLIDPGSKEPLSGQRLGNKRIAQHWRSHEKFMSDSAADEGVEATAEISGEGLPAKMEEMEEAEGMKAEREAGGSDELQSRFQELEGHLKESESKRMDQIHANMALHNQLKAVHEEKACLEEDKARLKEKLLSVVCSQMDQSPAPLTSPSTPPYQSVAKPDVKSEVEELAAQVEQAEDEKVELKQEISSLKKKLSQEVEKYNYHMAVVTQKLPISDPVAMMMMEAATNGDLSVMQLLVKQFVNVEGKDGRTPLLRAAERGHTDLVKCLAMHYEGDIFHKMEDSRSALHLAAYRGHLPVLQYLCPMFGDRMLDRDGKNETCLDIARRLGWESILEYLTQNYPQLEGKGSAEKEYVVTGLSDGASSRAHHRRWWLKAPAESSALVLPPSASIKQAGGPVEMVGEVEFRRDTQSNQTKVVSDTEWMYQRRALERGKQAAGSNLRWQRFTRYHQRWLANHVQTEEEESCGQWLLHQSPEVATVRETEEYRPGRVRYRYTTTAEKEWAVQPTQKTYDSTIMKLLPMPIKPQVISSVMFENKVFISGIATDYEPISRQVQIYSLLEGTWSRLPLAPSYNAPLAVINGHITLIGGRNTETGSITNILTTWSAKKRQWRQVVPPMPSRRLESGICFHNNLLLVSGGVEDCSEMPQVVKTVHVYNFSTRRWSTPEAIKLPKALRSPHLVALEENIYIVGGSSRYPALPQSDSAFNSHSWRARWTDIKEAINEAEASIQQDAQTAAGLQSSDPVKSVWTPIADPPALRSTGISWNNSLISVGGVKDCMPRKAIYKFVNGKVGNHWVHVGNMSEGRYRHAVVSIGNTALFVAGGCVMGNPAGEEDYENASSVELVFL